MVRRLYIMLILLLVVGPYPSEAAAKSLTIIHSNDMHSHFLDAPPNIDYTPSITGDDRTGGGWARIAAVIKQVKQERSNPVLVVNAGDFLMGSLFHMLSREQAFELRLLSMMRYDAVGLGNHEFDFKPGGLARILASARGSGKIPPLVASNVIFSAESNKDDALETIFSQGVVKPFLVLEKDGLRIGIFGLMGKDAAEVAPFASPVSFADPIAAAQKMVKVLRDTQSVDLVICLSHSGLSENPKKSEDEILARKIDGIDIIISGHTHTRVNDALQINNTIIVQSGAYGKQLGVLDINYADGHVSLNNYRLMEINDSISGDADIYNATFLKVIGDYNWQILKIVPKDRNGNPIDDLKRMRIDADRQKPGIQELKEWQGVIAYIQSFTDTDANGLPNVPDKYRGKLGRNVVEASWNPYQLLKRGNYITWLTLAALGMGVFILLGMVRFIVKKVG